METIPPLFSSGFYIEKTLCFSTQYIVKSELWRDYVLHGSIRLLISKWPTPGRRYHNIGFVSLAPLCFIFLKSALNSLFQCFFQFSKLK